MCASLLGESGASKGRNLPHPNPCQIFKNAGGNERRNPLQINPSVLTYKGGRSCREASIMPCTFGSPRTCQDLALLHQHTHTHTHAVITAWLQTIPLKTTRKEWESSSLHWKQGDGAQEQAWSLWLGLSPLAPSRIQFAFWKQKLWAAASDTSSAGSFNWSSQHLIS